MKKFELVFCIGWCVVFISIIYLSIITVKKPTVEKAYKIDNAEIYNR